METMTVGELLPAILKKWKPLGTIHGVRVFQKLDEEGNEVEDFAMLYYPDEHQLAPYQLRDLVSEFEL